MQTRNSEIVATAILDIPQSPTLPMFAALFLFESVLNASERASYIIAGASSIMVHYPPWYGIDKALASLELFATEVAPKFRTDAPKRMRA